MRTVSEVLAEEGLERIDLLKVDVEKSEQEVLAGIREEDWEKIKQVVLEVHDREGSLGRLERELARARATRWSGSRKRGWRGRGSTTCMRCGGRSWRGGRRRVRECRAAVAEGPAGCCSG